MGVYIKTKDGLKKVSVDSGSNDNPNPFTAEVTAESIKNALGYTPANAARVANIEDDESGEYYIVDPDGNIIFKIDADGLHTTAIEAQSLTLNGEAVVPGGTNSGDGDSGSDGGTVTIPQELVDHVGSKSNPHGVTASQVGLGNVDNTADIDKPVSTQQQAALNALRNALSEQIISESEEFHIIDAQGNIVATIDKDGVHSVDFITADGKSFKDYVDEKIAEIPTNESGNDVDTLKAYAVNIKSRKYPDGGTFISDSSAGVDKPIIVFEGSNGDEPVTLRNVEAPTDNTDAANKKYVDDKTTNLESTTIVVKSETYPGGGTKIIDASTSERDPVLEFRGYGDEQAEVILTNIGTPMGSSDAANKKYVDDSIGMPLEIVNLGNFNFTYSSSKYSTTIKSDSGTFGSSNILCIAGTLQVQIGESTRNFNFTYYPESSTGTPNAFFTNTYNSSGSLGFLSYTLKLAYGASIWLYIENASAYTLSDGTLTAATATVKSVSGLVVTYAK